MRRAATRTGEAFLARSRQDSGALLEEALFRLLYAHFMPTLLLTLRHDRTPRHHSTAILVHRAYGSHRLYNPSGQAQPHDRPPELLSTSHLTNKAVIYPALVLVVNAKLTLLGD